MSDLSDYALEAQDDEIRDLKRALKALADKCAAMEEPLNAVCAISAVHGFPYNGPQFGDELAAAYEALK